MRTTEKNEKKKKKGRSQSAVQEIMSVVMVTKPGWKQYFISWGVLENVANAGPGGATFAMIRPLDITKTQKLGQKKV